MSKHLSDDDIEAIVEVIDHWEGKLSWKLLTKHLADLRICNFGRTGLAKHTRIFNTFQRYKKQYKMPRKGRKPVTQEVERLLDKIELLETQNNRLSHENNQLLIQFATWAYNARLMGFSESELNNPMPEMDREQTVKRDAKRKPNRI